jgi:hypothetical protein
VSDKENLMFLSCLVTWEISECGCYLGHAILYEGIADNSAIKQQSLFRVFVAGQSHMVPRS